LPLYFIIYILDFGYIQERSAKHTHKAVSKPVLSATQKVAQQGGFFGYFVFEM
jgi:hypothetical protein